MTVEIAVLGMSCSTSGAATYADLWTLLLEGRVVVGPWPASRQRLSGVWSSAVTSGDRALARLERVMTGGYLDDVAGFDAGLFGISVREATAMDPQHRLLLEAAWAALQDAGLSPRALAGSCTGVYTGLSSLDYALLAHEAGYQTGAYAAVGSAKSLAANRISHALGLAGPSLSVDSACSSALVCVHLAGRALAAGDCDLAIAGGANLILAPTINVGFGKARMLSPRGRCRCFQKTADGYVRSEGVAAVVLKRLADAERDGDPVRAVICGSAVNQDGRTAGITVPSEAAQIRVIQRAWAEAGIGPDGLDAIEAHATGTPVGDAVELRALAAALRGRSPDRPPCAVASLKANIGHTEAAAGLFSLIKMVRVLETGELPPHVAPDEMMDMPGATGRVVFPRSRMPLACRANGESYSGVSAFGFGGTNGHVVLKSARRARPRVEARTPVLVTLSAANRESLESLTDAWALELERMDSDRFADAARTSNAAYASEPERIWALADSPAVGAAALRAARPATASTATALVITLMEARGLFSEGLDLFDPAEQLRLDRIRADQGEAFADKAVQASLARLAIALLPDVPLVAAGADVDVIGEISRSRRFADRGTLSRATHLIAVGAPSSALRFQGSVVSLTGDRASAVRALAALWAAGAAPMLESLAPSGSMRCGGLSPYPFQHSTYWFSHVDAPGDLRSAPSPESHGAVTVGLSLGEIAYLRDHRIAGAAIVPGATLVDLALSHAAAHLGRPDWIAEDVVFHAPLVLDEALDTPVNLSLSPQASAGNGDDRSIRFEFTRAGPGVHPRSARFASGTLSARSPTP